MFIKSILLVVPVFFLHLNTMADAPFTVSGYVRDAENGEALIGVNVVLDSLGKGTVTNAYGFYSLTMEAGEYDISFRYIGYATQQLKVDLSGNQELNIDLSTESVQMDEIVVTARASDANINDVGFGKNELSIAQIKKLPAFLGEPDIIKVIQMLPGVVSVGEGTSSYFVRGGSADQNLILIDEAPIYDPSHFFGLFSVFNSDVLKDSELYKGGIPARFGGRLSSVLDVRTKDGNNQKFGGSAGIGSMASRLMIEGPIAKDKASFIVSGRRSYADVFLKAAGKENLVHFYDMNAKINWRPNNKNQYFLALYMGRDVFDFSDLFRFGWGNRTATFRWNHLFNEKLFSNTSLIASNFDYKLGLDLGVTGFDWTSDLKEFTLKQDMIWYITPDHQLDFGYQGTYRMFAPGTITPTGEDPLFEELAQEELFALDHGVYLDMQSNFTDRFSVRYGMRLSVFQSIGESTLYTYEDVTDNINVVRSGQAHYGPFEVIKNYINPEPRVSARYRLNSKNSIKASYNRMVQNTHLIASGTVPLPFNTWQPSSLYLRPQKADQYAIGYFRNFLQDQLEFSLETYYKEMKDVTDFADNAQLFFNEDMPTEFRQGEAWGYGLETMLDKKYGKLSGFVSYTLSKAERKVPDVNRGETFVANYDRRHSFNLTATYDLTQAWTFGGNFTYGTGRPITIPSGRYVYENGYKVDYFTKRNGYRLPAYHRMDLSATLFTKKAQKKKIQGKWVFSVYNVYNRKNPFSVYTQVAEDEDGNVIGDGNQMEARMIYLFSILPSVTWNVTF